MNRTGFTINMLVTLTTLIHGAAENRPGTVSCLNSIAREFIGFTSKKKGSTIIQTPSTVEPGKEFSITVVYSDLPELKNPEILSQIATKLATNHDEPILSKETCNRLFFEVATEHAITTPYRMSRSGYQVFDGDRIPLSVLWIKLSQTCICSIGSRRAFIHIDPLTKKSKLSNTICSKDSYSFEDCKKEEDWGPNGPCISFNGYYMLPAQSLKKNVQTCAEVLHQETDVAFCLTIGIKKWLELQRNLHSTTDEKNNIVFKET